MPGSSWAYPFLRREMTSRTIRFTWTAHALFRDLKDHGNQWRLPRGVRYGSCGRELGDLGTESRRRRDLMARNKPSHRAYLSE
jgi:hypothetical protein